MNEQIHKRKFTIGVDGNEANIVKRVGVNTYAYETLASIYKLQDEWKDQLAFTIYLSSDPLPHMPSETSFWKYKVLKGKGMWIIRSLMPQLIFDSNRPDVFWTPSHYVPPIAFMPLVCSIMDVGYLDFSDQFRKKDFWQLKLWTAWSLLISKKVIAISEATRKDIVRHYGFTRNKVVATLLGYDENKYSINNAAKDVRRVKNSFNLDNYVIFVGTLKPSKNIEGLLHAWVIVSHIFPDTKLVIAGKKGWLFEKIFNLVKELKIDDSVVFTDFLSEKDKVALILGASLFVIPSFWEGFGLDALSAMACGVPVVAANRGSLPEVVGDAGILVSPDSHESIAGGIIKVLSFDKKERLKMISKGLTQVKKFSWEKTARKTLEVLQSVIKN